MSIPCLASRHISGFSNLSAVYRVYRFDRLPSDMTAAKEYTDEQLNYFKICHMVALQRDTIGYFCH